MTRLPDFLVIGAMKAGTTSLFFDLSTNPAVFFPDVKEPHRLAHDRVLTSTGRDAYAELYSGAAGSQICGDASTAYSRRPTITGVPERARRTCGEGVKVVYLVRNPVTRAISQHHYELAGGSLPASVDAAVREAPRLIDYGRYAYQVEPWIEMFGAASVLIVRFETFVESRIAVVREISEFLGVEAATEDIDPERVYNAGNRLWARRGALWRWSRGSFYRRHVRPLLGRALRERLRDRLLPAGPERPAPPSIDTIDYILERVTDDVERLQALAGWEEPPWDLVATRRQFLPSSEEPLASRSSQPGAQ